MAVPHDKADDKADELSPLTVQEDVGGNRL